MFKDLSFPSIIRAACCIMLALAFTSFNLPRVIKKQPADFIVKSIDPLIKVTPDFSSQTNETTDYYYARNEDVHIQLVVWNNPAIKNLSIDTKFTAFTKLPMVTIQRVGYVSIKQQSENIDNKIQSSTNQFPDPLFDVVNKVDLDAGSVTSFWVNFKIPSETKPGKYTVSLTCAANINSRPVNITKQVNIVVTKAASDPKKFPWLANWVIVDMPTMGPTTKKLKYMNNNVDVTPFDNNYWKKINAIASFMTETGQNVIMMSPQRLAKYSYTGNKLQIDFSRLDSMLDCYAKNKLIGRLEGWQICSRSGGFESNYVVYYIKKDSLGRAFFASGQPEDADVQAFYKVYLPALIQHLKSKNLYDIYYQHIADEPLDANADSYIRIIKMIKSIAPDIKTFEPIQTMKVAEYLTIPIPQLDYLNNHSQFFEKLVKQGKEVWFYTAFVPQGTYANRFIEQQALKHRLLFWILAKYNLKGTLNWGFDYWDVPNPYKDLGIKSGRFILPAGDSWLAYPKADGLVSSIRLKTMTDGLNDYALLQMLKQKNPRLARSLINEVVSDYKTYTSNIELFRNVRMRLLEALN